MKPPNWKPYNNCFLATLLILTTASSSDCVLVVIVDLADAVAKQIAVQSIEVQQG